MVKCTGFSKDDEGKVTEVAVEIDSSYEGKKPPKGVIHWVSQAKPGQVERLARLIPAPQI